MSKMVKLSEQIRDSGTWHQMSKNFIDADPEGFTATATTGTVAVVDERGGGISLLTQAADNAEGTLVSDANMALLAADKPLYFSARAQYAEANTDDANVYIGMTDDAAGDILGDDGAGPAANYDGIGFFKVDGGTLWQVEASNGTDQVTKTLDADTSLDGLAKTAGGSSYQKFEIEVLVKTATAADVMFLIDGTLVYKITDWDWSNLSAMALAAKIKAGSANAETLKVTYMNFATVL